MQNGALIAVPIPEEYEAIGEKIQNWVNQAVSESERNGVSSSGKDATPWLLNRIAELSGGSSLASNIALLESTALVGEQNSVVSSLLDLTHILCQVVKLRLSTRSWQTSRLAKRSFSSKS